MDAPEGFSFRLIRFPHVFYPGRDAEPPETQTSAETTGAHHSQSRIAPQLQARAVDSTYFRSRDTLDRRRSRASFPSDLASFLPGTAAWGFWHTPGEVQRNPEWGMSSPFTTLPSRWRVHVHELFPRDLPSSFLLHTAGDVAYLPHRFVNVSRLRDVAFLEATNYIHACAGRGSEDGGPPQAPSPHLLDSTIIALRELDLFSEWLQVWVVTAANGAAPLFPSSRQRGARIGANHARIHPRHTAANTADPAHGAVPSRLQGASVTPFGAAEGFEGANNTLDGGGGGDNGDGVDGGGGGGGGGSSGADAGCSPSPAPEEMSVLHGRSVPPLRHTCSKRWDWKPSNAVALPASQDSIVRQPELPFNAQSTSAAAATTSAAATTHTTHLPFIPPASNG